MYSRLCVVSSVEASHIRIQYQDTVYVDFTPETTTDPESEQLHEDSSTKVFKLATGTYAVLRFDYSDVTPFTVTIDDDEQALVSQVKKDNLTVMRSTDVESLIEMQYTALDAFKVDRDVFPNPV